MQNEQTLIELGFTHFPEWDYKEIGVKCFVLETDFAKWIAHECSTLKPLGVSLGKLVKIKKHGPVVDYWRDCFSHNSIANYVYQKDYYPYQGGFYDKKRVINKLT